MLFFFVVLLFIAVFKYSKRDRTIRYIKLSFFFLEKIDCFIHVVKLRFIKNDVAIIIYVVFFWISDSKLINEVIFYQIWNECLRFHFLIFFECICFFLKMKTFYNRTFLNEQSHFELISSTIFAWISMMSFSSMMTITFDSICAQRRNNILSKDFSTILHVLWCILCFRLTIHQNVQIFRFVQRYSSSINFN
jgi:hypothetical protein